MLRCIHRVNKGFEPSSEQWEPLEYARDKVAREHRQNECGDGESATERCVLFVFVEAATIGHLAVLRVKRASSG